MKIFRSITLLFLVLLTSFGHAAVVPAGPQPSKFDIRTIKVKDIEKITGQKLNFFQKIRFKIAQRIIQKKFGGELTEKQQKQANASMILGIASLALMFLSLVPYISIIAILCIPAAILAIIFGAKSLKGNSNSKGLVGVITGSATLALIAVFIIVVAIAFSGFQFE